MINKETDIKPMIELIISNIDEFSSKFVTYKAESMKLLLQNTLEYIEQKEEECERLKEWQEANQPTGICETCTAKSVEDKYKYKKAIEEIEEGLIPICESCRKYYYNQHCEDCDTGVIKDIINKTKE